MATQPIVIVLDKASKTFSLIQAGTVLATGLTAQDAPRRRMELAYNAAAQCRTVSPLRKDRNGKGGR